MRLDLKDLVDLMVLPEIRVTKDSEVFREKEENKANLDRLDQEATVEKKVRERTWMISMTSPVYKCFRYSKMLLIIFNLRIGNYYVH